ncbi:MAG: cysteine synthase family protein, partial [Actinobacteria bacterium]
ELRRLSPKPSVRLWAKLESHNPTGSVKDRVARAMVEDAEERGTISPGQTILEPTSGNTGISLAMICRRRGYPLKVVMPENVTPERTRLLEMYGAEIVYSEGAKGSNGAVEMALEMAERDARYYMPYQYGNQANPLAHYHGTGPEILEELDEVAAFVAGLGTGGTLMGVGRRLKEELGDSVKVVAAEPMQGEPVQGLRSLDDGFIPPIIDLSLLDRKIFVTNRDAIVWTRKLLEEEGIFAGVSSGAIAAIAVRIAGELDEGNVVFVVADDGWKYLSSGIYTKPVDEVAAFVAGLGTGGTLMGVGRRLKEELGDSVKVVAAEPMQGEPVQGLRSLDDGFIPPIIDLSLLDRKIFVTNRDAIVWTRKLLEEEGIFAGVSSGAIAAIAVRIAGELDEGNVVFVVADDGWKYLSSGIYTKPVDEVADLDSTVWW